MPPNRHDATDTVLRWFNGQPWYWRALQIARWRTLTLLEVLRPLTVPDMLVIAFDAAEREAEAVARR